MTNKGFVILVIASVIVLVLLGLIFIEPQKLIKSKKLGIVDDNITDAVSGLNGLWVAGDEFCSKAGLDGMILYLGDAAIQDGPNEVELPACIIMHADNKTLAFKKFDIVFSMKEVNKNKKLQKIKFSAKIQESDSDDREDSQDDGVLLTDIFPSELQISYKPFKSNLVFYEILDGKKNVYANLVKDNVSSL